MKKKDLLNRIKSLEEENFQLKNDLDSANIKKKHLFFKLAYNYLQGNHTGANFSIEQVFDIAEKIERNFHGNLQTSGDLEFEVYPGDGVYVSNFEK